MMGTIKALEEVRLIFLRDSPALVMYCYNHLVALPLLAARYLYLDLRISGAVFQGVRDQVMQNLLNAIPIGRNDKLLFRRFKHNTALLRNILILLNYLANQLCNVNILPLTQIKNLSSYARHIEHFGNELVHALHLVDDLF